MDELIKALLALIGDRTQLIEGIVLLMERRIQGAQIELLNQVVTDFLDILDLDEAGRIKNTIANKRKINLLDRLYADFVRGSSAKIIKEVVKQIGKIEDYNKAYFSFFDKPAELGPIFDTTRASIQDWLGISKKGVLLENGYLNTLVKNEPMKGEIRDQMFRAIISQKGHRDAKRGLEEYITGAPGETGALQKYYRNFVYDTFSQVDRTQAKMVADKLAFKYAIWEGGLVKKSRKVCIQNNGKVFRDDEIAAISITEARPPNYDPFTDMGGYACRHHWNWIPESVAFALRPELRTLPPVPPADPPPVKDKPAGPGPEQPV